MLLKVDLAASHTHTYILLALIIESDFPRTELDARRETITNFLLLLSALPSRAAFAIVPSASHFHWFARLFFAIF